jgi:hypothetical protein
MALTGGFVLRNLGSLLLALGVFACASASPSMYPDVDATLSRGGGLSGISETIRIWSISGEPHGTVQLSNERRARTIRLPRQTLDSTLVVIESLISVLPRIPADTGLLRPICGDAILTHIQVRRGSHAQSAQEECPHRTPASETYWQRVDSLFQFLAFAAR